MYNRAAVIAVNYKCLWICLCLRKPKAKYTHNHNSPHRRACRRVAFLDIVFATKTNPKPKTETVFDGLIALKVQSLLISYYKQSFPTPQVNILRFVFFNHPSIEQNQIMWWLPVTSFPPKHLMLLATDSGCLVICECGVKAVQLLYVRTVQCCRIHAIICISPSQ